MYETVLNELNEMITKKDDYDVAQDFSGHSLKITVEGADFEDLGWIAVTIRRKLRRKYNAVIVNAKDSGTPGIDLPCSGDIRIHVPYGKIRYIVSSGHYVLVYGIPGTGKYLTSFKSVAENIEDDRFLYCNRGILLNMDHIIREEHHGFVMDDGAFFPSRQRGHKKAAEQFRTYLLRRQ